LKAKYLIILIQKIKQDSSKDARKFSNNKKLLKKYLITLILKQSILLTASQAKLSKALHTIFSAELAYFPLIPDCFDIFFSLCCSFNFLGN